jgi:hypothetical protein
LVGLILRKIEDELKNIANGGFDYGYNCSYYN